MLKCVIVDNEQFSIDALMKYTELLPRLDVSAVYRDPLSALENLTAEKKIDIVFMDIDMPNMSGIELAAALRGKINKLIFTTSHSKYAFDAYNVEGDAFLLKPYSFAKFSMTISRLFPLADQEPKNPVVLKQDDYFLVKNKDENLRIIKVPFKEVIAFESSMNYVKIHLINNRVLTAYLTLKDIIELVAQKENFRQFHRAFIICTDCISYIEGNMVHMNNNLSFTVGESYRDKFTSYLNAKLLRTSRKH